MDCDTSELDIRARRLSSDPKKILTFVRRMPGRAYLSQAVYKMAANSQLKIRGNLIYDIKVGYQFTSSHHVGSGSDRVCECLYIQHQLEGN